MIDGEWRKSENPEATDLKLIDELLVILWNIRQGMNKENVREFVQSSFITYASMRRLEEALKSREMKDITALWYSFFRAEIS